MLSLFKSDPLKKLQKKRSALLKEAMEIQRSGNLKLYATKMEAINKLELQIDELRK